MRSFELNLRRLAFLALLVCAALVLGKLSDTEQAEGERPLSRQALAMRTKPDDAAARIATTPAVLRTPLNTDDVASRPEDARRAALSAAPSPNGSEARPLSASASRPSIDRDASRPRDVSRKPRLESGVRFAIGDRIKIRAFEIVQGADAGARALIDSAELSGDMVVEAGGVAFAPLVGAVMAFNRSPEAVADEIARRARALSGVEAQIALQLSSRRPVFLRSGEGAARVVDYEPGLLLVQAIAQLGAVGGQQDPLWQRIDLAREEERLQAAKRQLARSLAVVAILEAEAAEPVPSRAELERRLDPETARQLDTAAAERENELETRRQRRRSIEAELALTERQLAHFRKEAKDSEAALSEALQRAARTRELFGRGHTTQQNMTLIEGHLREEKRRSYEMRSALMRLEERSLDLSNQLKARDLEAEIERARALREAQAKAVEAQASIDAIDRWVTRAVRRNGVAPTGGKKTAAQYRICRPKPGGVACRETDDLYSKIMPGDVVEIMG